MGGIGAPNFHSSPKFPLPKRGISSPMFYICGSKFPVKRKFSNRLKFKGWFHSDAWDTMPLLEWIRLSVIQTQMLTQADNKLQGQGQPWTQPSTKPGTSPRLGLDNQRKTHRRNLQQCWEIYRKIFNYAVSQNNDK